MLNKRLLVIVSAIFLGFSFSGYAQQNKSALTIVPNADTIPKDKDGKDKKFVALKIKNNNGTYEIIETAVYKGEVSSLRKSQPNPGDWVIKLMNDKQEVVAQTAIATPIPTTVEVYGGETMKRVPATPRDEFWIRAVWVDGATDLTISKATSASAENTVSLVKTKTDKLSIREVEPTAK